MLSDRGLDVTSGSLPPAAIANITVPETVHAVIAARLDTLSRDRKQLIHAGRLTSMSR